MHINSKTAKLTVTITENNTFRVKINTEVNILKTFSYIFINF